MDTKKLAQNSKKASVDFLSSKAEARNDALRAISHNLLDNISEIISANEKDIQTAKENNLNEAMVDRLLLTEERIKNIAQTALDIADQPEVVGAFISEEKRPNGLVVKKQRMPLGVIAMIFESRPNVVIDCSCLAIKSGNAIILKGGKEANHSNAILVNIVRESIKDFLPIDVVQLVESREAVSELIKLNDEVDVVIPRGGKKLIQYVYDNASIPVIAHFEGLCHIYIHHDADLEKAKAIVLNAKTQRPGVCNAMECLLLHKDLPQNFKEDLMNAFITAGVELRASEDLTKINSNILKATNADYATEYLDKKLSVKVVDGIGDAISHIQTYGTNHTEAILAKDEKTIALFQNSIEASCIVVNASTRFNDGGELGLGAELGISTTKFHAYGPMGAAQMTTERYVVVGSGQIRE